MARDRQRAKQRKQRRAPSQGGGNSPTPDPQPIHRENVPGPLEHTGDVDEFEAAIVAGADGQPETDPDAAERAEAEAEREERFAPDVEESTGATAASTGPVVRHSEHAPAQGGGASRFLNFLRACWAELQRVQWPDRRQVGQATAVVLGFVIVAGAFLGLADVVAEKIVDFVI